MLLRSSSLSLGSWSFAINKAVVLHTTPDSRAKKYKEERDTHKFATSITLHFYLKKRTENKRIHTIYMCVHVYIKLDLLCLSIYAL